MNPTDAAAALPHQPAPAPGATPEPHGAPAAAPDAGTNAFAALLAALAGVGPPPTPGPQAEARTATAEGTEAGSDSPGPNENSNAQGALPGAVLLEGQLASSLLPAGLPGASALPALAQAGTGPVDDQASEALHAGAEAALTVATTAPEAGPVRASRHADDLAIDHEVVAPAAAPGPSAEMRAGARFDREQLAESASQAVEMPVEHAAPLVSPAKPLMNVDPDWKPELDPVLRGEQAQSPSPGGHGASGFERQLYEDPELGEPFVGTGRAVPIGGAVPETGGLLVSLDGPAATEPVAARRPATSQVNELWETTKTAIRVAVRNGQTEARITLRPAELGEVRITLRYENGGVSAALTADSAQAFEALAQAATELRRGLEQQGVSVLGLEVRMSGDEAQREASLWQDGTASAESPYDEPLGEDESQDEASEQADPGNEPGGIDVFA